jgi:pimeloyl-ACP methyl ester carboxylesterase
VASLPFAPAAFAPRAVIPATRFADARPATGVRLRYAEVGDADRPAVVLLHGMTDSAFSFSRVVEGLAATHRVIALDQRGHGRSDRPAVGYAPADLAADVVAFLDALGIGRASVVGHSLGSLVAQHVAARAPDRVERLVLVGSTADPRGETVAGLRDAVVGMPDEIPAPFVREFQESTVHRPLPPAFLDHVVAVSRRVPRHVWVAALDGLLADDAPAPLARIVAPTLLLWGDRDAIFGRAAQDALLAGLPQATLRVYAGTGHAPHWEEPERFVGDVRDFLARSA